MSSITHQLHCESREGRQIYAQPDVKWRRTRRTRTYLLASCRMSFLRRSSMASKFSARSDIDNVLRGREASRSTNGRPDMYTKIKRFGIRQMNIVQLWRTIARMPGWEIEMTNMTGGLRSDSFRNLGEDQGHPPVLDRRLTKCAYRRQQKITYQSVLPLWKTKRRVLHWASLDDTSARTG
jgi:hypothetical protein